MGSIAGTFLAGFGLMYLIPYSTVVQVIAAALALLAAAFFGRMGGLVLGLLTAVLLGLGAISPLVRAMGLGGLDLGSYRINYLSLGGNLTGLLLGVVGAAGLIAARKQDEGLEEATSESAARRIRPCPGAACLTWPCWRSWRAWGSWPWRWWPGAW